MRKRSRSIIGFYYLLSVTVIGFGGTPIKDSKQIDSHLSAITLIKISTPTGVPIIVPIVGNTNADDSLRDTICGMLLSEAQKDLECITIDRMKVEKLKGEGNGGVAGNTVDEKWIVYGCGRSWAYDITFTPSGSATISGFPPPKPGPVFTESDAIALPLSCQNGTGFYEIDFNNCTPRIRRIDLALGSTTYEILGPSNDGLSCRFRWGGEVENPMWDGVLRTECLVPRKLGKQKFAIFGGGLNFSPIEKYCHECKDCPISKAHL